MTNTIRIASWNINSVRARIDIVERFLRETGMPWTKFGRLAAHDPRFVLDLRMGRTPRPDTELRTRAWMQGYADRAAACTREAA